MTSFIDRAAANHALLRERLVKEFDLESDDEAVADTLDGISDFKELCVRAIREARKREAYADGLKSIIEDNQTRKKRHEDAADRIRDAVANAMLEAGEKKIEAPDMTVSFRWNPSKVFYIGRVPIEYQCTETVVKNDTKAIKEALDNGYKLDFAELSNPKPSISVRQK